MSCAFCGETEGVAHYRTVPDRFGHYEFCKKGDCYTKYNAYVYRDTYDMSYGVPVAVMTEDQRREIADDIVKKCAYCGAESSVSVTKNWRLGAQYNHNTFCRNDSCCRQYISFMDNFDRIPQCLLEEAVIIVNSSSTNATTTATTTTETITTTTALTKREMPAAEKEVAEGVVKSIKLRIRQLRFA